MFDKCLIDMSKPEDALVWRQTSTGTGFQSKFTPAFGPEQKDEVGDIVYIEKGKNIYYHEHLDGCETFFFVEGEWEGLAMGKRFPLHPGDILHIQPFQGHGFQALSDRCRVIVMFQGKDMRYGLERNMYVKENFPELVKTPAFRRRSTQNNHDIVRTLDFSEAPEGDAPCRRRFGEGICTHELPGMTLRLTVGRYETHGVKEVWEASLKKGVRVAFTEPRVEQRLFWVREGHVSFTVGKDTFVAGPNMLVYAPPYHPCSFEAVEDANIVDLDCPFFLQDFLEELERMGASEPEKLCDGDAVSELMERFKVPPAAYSYHGPVHDRA